MTTDPFVLECSGLPPGARVIAIDGREEISTTYRYEIDLLVDPDADLGDAVSASATLTVRSDAHEGCPVHGIIASASVMENLDGFDLYRLVLVPRVRDVLGLDRHSRVFVNETVPGILQTLLREAGFAHGDCEFRLSKTYEPIDFVCQYRESTLDFLMRWMERDGIYFHFAHDGEGERLVIVDDKAQDAPSRVSAPYLRSVGLNEGEGLRRFRAERRAVPGRVQVDDYDYLRPALPVKGEASVDGGGGGELRVRGANVRTPKDAQRIAALRAEGLRARQTTFHGEGKLYGLHAGERFTLSGHPRATLDGDYLVTSLRVRGHSDTDLGSEMKALLGRRDEPDEVLRVELEAIWGDVQYRPELRTPAPRVSGMESGVIEGDAESDYAQIDDHGRYLVKFRFDERGGRGSQASARLRMMQPHAGSPEGMHFPLRKWTEVLVAFIGGDPDRPVIAGAVPNALNASVVRADNATKNIIQTGGGNRITMEDMEGKQYIHISSPHKGSYIHIGSPFNPQYNKITNTTGTSLTYTQDISTSVTGTDAQTFVEDARLTIIGRANIFSDKDEQAGKEITALLGPGFVGAQTSDFEAESDILLAQIAADAAKALKDATAKAISTGSPLGPPPPKVTVGPSGNLLTVLAAVEQLLTDMQTLASDATSYSKAAGSPPANFPSPTNASQWAAQVAQAEQALTEAEILLSASPPDLAAINGTGSPPSGGVLAFATQAAVTAAKGAPSAARTAAQADFPSPNATPTYIRLPHASWHTTTLAVTGTTAVPNETVDQFIEDNATTSPPGLGGQLEKHDVTALDVLDKGAYPNVFDKILHRHVPTPNPDVGRPVGKAYHLTAGSDVKVVGGDNVTLAAHDARSHTVGHSYGLVEAGQTAVVYTHEAYAGAIGWEKGGKEAEAAVAEAQTNVDNAKQGLIHFLEALGFEVILVLVTVLPGLVLSSAGGAVSNLTVGNIQGVINDLQALQATVDGFIAGIISTLVGKVQQLAMALTALDSAKRRLQHLLKRKPNRPSMPMPFDPSTIAQVSTAYGNTRSWVDGNTDGTIVGNTNTTIGGSKTAWIKHDTKTTVGGSVTTHIKHDQHTTIGDPGLVIKILEGVAVGAEAGAAVGAVVGFVAGAAAGSLVTTNIWGNRITTLLGTDTSLTVGLKTSAVLGASTAAVIGAKTAFTLGLKTDVVIAGKINFSIGPTIATNGLSQRTELTHIHEALVALQSHDVHAADGALKLIAHDLVVLSG